MLTEIHTAEASIAETKPREMGDPADLNGDDCLWGEWLDAYMEYHRSRNDENHARSRCQGIRTKRFGCVRFPADAVSSPSRAALDAFFLFAARRMASRFVGRDITIIDLGCGGAPCRRQFERAGYRGTYIGVDIARNANWTDEPTPAFRHQLILGDAMTMDLDQIPRADLIVSATALEHIRRDAEVIQRWGSKLVRGGGQIHFVPGSGSLPLYQGHGWRQYSPACLRKLFPEGEIYRVCGVISSWLHWRAITKPEAVDTRKSLRQRSPQLYRNLRTLSLYADTLLCNTRPSMYGVICE